MRWVGLLVVLAGCRFGFEDVPRDAAAGVDAEGLRIAQMVGGVDTTCVRSNTGLVTCWGNNIWGKLGIPSSDPSDHGDEPGELRQLRPIDLGTGRTATELVRGADYTCALLDDQAVKCWGNNDGSQLGLGDFDHRGDFPGDMGDALGGVLAGGGGPFTAATAGHYHTCVIREGRVWCFGVNDFGQNGAGDNAPHAFDVATVPPIDLGAFLPVALSAQFNATCALDAIGRMKCWGEGGSGSLGYGDVATRGDDPSELGDNLPFVPLGVGVVVTQLAAGYDHQCALSNAGAVCWGGNDNGQLGTGNTAHYGDNPNEVGSLQPLDLGEPIAALSAGNQQTCALLSSGAVACWGANDHGQLGLGDKDNRGDQPGELGPNLRVPLPEPAIAVSCGHSHNCAILASGSMACWGRNGEGELGAGDTQDRGDDPGEQPFVIRATDLW